MRAPNLDPDGNIIPFEDFQDFRKLQYLVPEADCDTRAGVITAWRDARPQPTYDEIEAVSDADADAWELDETIKGALGDPVIEAIVEEIPGLKAKVVARLRQRAVGNGS